MNEMEFWLRNNDSFGLQLPDGWFGRPFDNCHQITWREERTNKLILELDKQLYLIFTKPIKFAKSGSDLVISGFQQLVFDYQGYGDMVSHSDTYKSGEVTLVSLPG